MEAYQSLSRNKEILEPMLQDCADVIQRSFKVGLYQDIDCYLVYLEPTFSNSTLGSSSIGIAIDEMKKLTRDQIPAYCSENTIPDLTAFTDIDQAVDALMAGNGLFFVDGSSTIMKIQDKGYPGLGVHTSDNEKVARGSEECFSDSVKTNATLLRKRLRTTSLKVKELHLGKRSHTLVYLVYLETIAKPETVQNMEEKLDSFEIDATLDTGVIEQLTEKNALSPFPQYQSTRRPDRAAEALLAGRVVLISDNSPEALLLPVTLETFMETADDRFLRFEMASFTKMLRYIAAFLAMTLPGFYLVAINFHNQIIPIKLLLSLSAAATGTPFPAVVEVLIMELAFELLREAGIRMPGNAGNAIGIVGGLIVGTAAVDANLVSPIVVIVIALTALCSFTIPSEELATAFRILKFAFIIICAWLGFYGYLLMLLAVLLHMAGLQSFATGYLELGVAGIRKPIYKEWKRPKFAQPDNRRRLRKGKK